MGLLQEQRAGPLTLQGGVSGDCAGQRRPLTTHSGPQGPGHLLLALVGAAWVTTARVQPVSVKTHRGQTLWLGAWLQMSQAVALAGLGCQEKTPAVQGTAAWPRRPGGVNALAAMPGVTLPV